MVPEHHLSIFFKVVCSDPRIGVSHISLYCAIFHLMQLQKSDPIHFMSDELMKVAKIAGLATFYKCLKDLHEQGYIRYIPSYNHRRKSMIYLL